MLFWLEDTDAFAVVFSVSSAQDGPSAAALEWGTVTEFSLSVTSFL